MRLSAMANAARIGVLTFHRCINYGSYWQARCLVEGLRARGHDAVLLDHDCSAVNFREWRCSFQPKLPERTARTDFRHYKQKVRKFFDAFARLPRSDRFPLHRPEAAGAYDRIIVGSDEVWNFRHPWYGGKPIFFGSGLNSRRLVSYAASFGNHDAEWGIDPDWARKLEDFASISVRDENSRRLVQRALGKSPQLVLDPCLQFPDPARPPASSGDRRYALVYGHGFPAWLEQSARRWSERSAIPLISIGYRNDWADEQSLGAGPSEFAEAMAGASAVITNFFHGCIFALMNGKPFACAPSEYRFNKVRDLAASLGAEHRIVTRKTAGELAELLGQPSGTEVTERVAQYRRQSDEFLDAALA